MPETDRTATRGLRAAVRQVLASLIEIGRTRLELLTVELEEERLHLARLLVIAASAFFLLLFGVLFAAGWIVLLCDPANRVHAVGAIAAAFLVAGGVAAWQCSRMSKNKPAFLHATLGELKRDSSSLTGRDEP